MSRAQPGPISRGGALAPRRHRHSLSACVEIGVRWRSATCRPAMARCPAAYQIFRSAWWATPPSCWRSAGARCSCTPPGRAEPRARAAARAARRTCSRAGCAPRRARARRAPARAARTARAPRSRSSSSARSAAAAARRSRADRAPRYCSRARSQGRRCSRARSRLHDRAAAARGRVHRVLTRAFSDASSARWASASRCSRRLSSRSRPPRCSPASRGPPLRDGGARASRRDRSSTPPRARARARARLRRAERSRRVVWPQAHHPRRRRGALRCERFARVRGSRSRSRPRRDGPQLALGSAPAVAARRDAGAGVGLVLAYVVVAAARHPRGAAQAARVGVVFGAEAVGAGAARARGASAGGLVPRPVRGQHRALCDGEEGHEAAAGAVHLRAAQPDALAELPQRARRARARPRAGGVFSLAARPRTSRRSTRRSASSRASSGTLTPKRGSLTPAEFEEIWRHLLADHLRALQFLTLTKGGRRALLEQAEREHSGEAIRFLLLSALPAPAARRREQPRRQCAAPSRGARDRARVRRARRRARGELDAAQRKEVLASAAFLREHVKLAAGDEFTRALVAQRAHLGHHRRRDQGARARFGGGGGAAAAPGLAQLLERDASSTARAAGTQARYVRALPRNRRTRAT